MGAITLLDFQLFGSGPIVASGIRIMDASLLSVFVARFATLAWVQRFTDLHFTAVPGG